MSLVSPRALPQEFLILSRTQESGFLEISRGPGGVVVCSSRPSGCPVELGEMQVLNTGRLRACVLGVPRALRGVQGSGVDPALA